MKSKKIFGVSTNTNIPSCFENTKSIGVSSYYVTSIELAGGVPLLLPPVKDNSDIEKQLELIDVLIMSGGNDVDPVLYGEEHSELLEEICPNRDRYELELLKMAHKKGIPIFGICRGLQLINVAFGGSLYQDISHFPDETIDHNQQGVGDTPFHPVNIEEGTLLAQIVGKNSLATNSFHHQAIKKLSPDFKVNARTEDGLIEGIESKEGSPVLAVQWHPEIMAGTDFFNLKLFQYFVNL